MWGIGKRDGYEVNRRARAARRTVARWEVTALEERLLLTVMDLNSGASFATIQAAVNAATPGDTLKASAGTYNEAVNINKTLTLLGAQSGVDARTRPGTPATESIVTGAITGITLAANGVIVDGFTVNDATTLAGGGIVTTGSFTGDQVLNNIIENNIFGIYLNSSGGARTVVRQNLIENNNQAGPVSGGGIYSDQGFGNVLIDNNAFTGQNFAAIYLNGFPGTQTGLTITNNQFTNTRGAGVADTTGVTVTGNTFTGVIGSALGLAGGVANATVASNTFLNGTGRGVYVSTLTDPTAPNSNVTVNLNRFFNNPTAGLEVATGAETGTLDATNNWWGGNAGPNAAGNDKVVGVVNASTWLVLTLTPMFPTIGPGGTSQFSASFDLNNLGTNVATTATFPNGTPVAFSATGGTVNPTPALTLGGIATTNFTSATAGSASVSAMLDNQTVTTSINVQAIAAISPATIPPGTVGQMVNVTFVATGGSGAITYPITAGQVPTGLMENPITGALTGTLTAPGTFNFTVEAVDQSGAFVTQNYSVLVSPSLAIKANVPPPGTVGGPYSDQLSATGGAAPITFSLANGSTLPPGLTLSAAGLITGTPTTAGTTNFTVKATDQNGSTASLPLSILINPALVIAPNTPPPGTVGNLYADQFSATGGTAPLTFALANGSALPPGLKINNMGLISGIPTAAGTFPFTLTVTDAAGATKSINESILVNPAVAINPNVPPPATVGVPYSDQLATTGGTAPVNFAITQTGPAGLDGLSLSANGLISGTPITAGTVTFTVSATDRNGSSAFLPVTITVSPAQVAAPPPTVTNLQRFGFHNQPTTYVLSFSEALDPARAQDVNNYRLVQIGGNGRAVPIGSAVYDATTHTVTLHPTVRVYIFREYRLTVNGSSPTGVASASGALLDGQGTGKPGTDYVTLFDKNNLAGPAPTGQTAGQSVHKKTAHHVAKPKHV